MPPFDFGFVLIRVKSAIPGLHEASVSALPRQDMPAFISFLRDKFDRFTLTSYPPAHGARFYETRLFAAGRL
jgi:hypothetical protein